jgi:hypothetical protein
MIRKLRFGGSVRPRTAKLGKLKTRIRRPRSPLDPVLPYVVLIVFGVIYFVLLYAHFAR